MKITTDAIPVREASSVSTSKATQPAVERREAAAPADAVKLSSLATELSARSSDEAERADKIEAMRQALREGRSIVDKERIADAILTDARGGS